MGREVRMVPPTWEHPKDSNGRLIPLYEGPIEDVLAEWFNEAAQWLQGEYRHQRDDDPRTYTAYVEYAGTCPDPEKYMPTWDDSEHTHYQMYENTSEGTPLSPPMPTPEVLARWLADNEASAFGGMTATYEQWLRMIEAGYAPTRGSRTDGDRPMSDDVGWVEYLVIEPGQALLFKVNEEMDREQIERMSDLIAQRIDVPFIVMAGDITITVVDR